MNPSICKLKPFPKQYKTERDGVVETRVEQKITIQSDGDPIDHDRALAEAIQEATAMNPDMTVEKIEIQQQQTNQWGDFYFIYCDSIVVFLFNLKKA